MNQNVSTTRSGHRLGTRQLTTIGMLSAISIVLGATGYGFIPLPMAKATILHIPVIVGAIIEGPLVGAVIGFFFGMFSLIQNYTAPSSIFSPAFQNPIVSVLPRILIGIVSYYSYKLMLGKNENIKVGAGAVVGTLTNTFVVLTMIYLLYPNLAFLKPGAGANSAAKIIYGIALTNGIPEVIVGTLITVPIVMAIKKIKK
ncbi:ECF transporter S component [Clostridium swellfunianum]|uniref:ECF transporter S component n=1 Tax=Clostridium swellfunianum TaxID=1367462 RepID=UPI00202EB768|nr:ECF transporter S component [Clostridium swellfunianum]MCM0646946.1 ECF transporter S component [Clostridium swellfunianum]